MRIQSHLDKIARLESLRARLDPLDDFELWFWAAMTAATNGVNAVHHHLGLAQVTPYHPHQIPAVYVEPEPRDGAWIKVIAPPGDVIHVGLPPLQGQPPPALVEIYAALETLEGMRERYVRGNEPITPEVIATTRASHQHAMELVRQLLGQESADHA